MLTYIRACWSWSLSQRETTAVSTLAVPLGLPIVCAPICPEGATDGLTIDQRALQPAMKTRNTPPFVSHHDDKYLHVVQCPGR